jgi:hypothetical protein
MNICPIGCGTVQSGRILTFGEETPSIVKVFCHYEGESKYFSDVGKF